MIEGYEFYREMILQELFFHGNPLSDVRKSGNELLRNEVIKIIQPFVDEVRSVIYADEIKRKEILFRKF